MEISKIFQNVPDPHRNTLLKMHILSDILVLSLLATISGCENDKEIAEYGKSKELALMKIGLVQEQIMELKIEIYLENLHYNFYNKTRSKKVLLLKERKLLGIINTSLI